MIVLGIIAGGGIFAGANPSYGVAELTHHYQASCAKYLIVEPDILGNVLVAAEKCAIPASNIFIFDVLGQVVPNGFRSWDFLRCQGEKHWKMFDDEFISKTTTVARLNSSGTTGLPKAANISNYNFVAQHMTAIDPVKKSYIVRRLVTLPLFHAAAAPTTHTSALRSGHQNFIMRRFELQKFLAAIRTYEITDITIPPPVVLTLLRSLLATPEAFKTIKHAITGAAPLAKDLQNALQARFPYDSTFTQTYAMTESCCYVTQTPWPERDATGSAGYTIKNVEMK